MHAAIEIAPQSIGMAIGFPVVKIYYNLSAMSLKRFWGISVNPICAVHIPHANRGG